MAGPRRQFATSPALIAAIEKIADAVGVDTGLPPLQTTATPPPLSEAGGSVAVTPSQFHHTHVQDLPSTLWDVVHPLKYRPAAMTVLDDAGNPWWPDVTWIDDQHVVLAFPLAVRGRADLS